MHVQFENVCKKRAKKKFQIAKMYSVFPKVVARKELKNATFPQVVAFAQPKLVAQPEVVAFSAQLLLETHCICKKKSKIFTNFFLISISHLNILKFFRNWKKYKRKQWFNLKYTVFHSTDFRNSALPLGPVFLDSVY